MKKIGKFNLIKDVTPCEEQCECGWNIHIGGLEKEDYIKLKKILKTWENEVKKPHEDKANSLE